MSVYIVTGLGYGDEGKGGVVDALCRQGNANLVVRHNGGSQAGHNVVLPDGTHHEFSQFGSGTLQCASTYLSSYMLVNPGDMELEADALNQKLQEPYNIWQFMNVSAEAKIVTPYHTALNRVQERFNRHGSCGKGIGVTMQQDIDRPDLTIRVKDLLGDERTLMSKLTELRRYLNVEFKGYGMAYLDAPQEFDVLHHGLELVAPYVDWAQKVNIVEDEENWLYTAIGNHANTVFEGSQGVLLDEWRGFHPHTTWSTTTPHNARKLLNFCGYDGEVQELGITRAFQTRHGAGPMPSEAFGTEFDEPHNHTGKWQGEFRWGALDLVTLRYAVAVHGRTDKMRLVVTHLDRAEDWWVTEAYDTKHFIGIRDLMINPDLEDLNWQGELTWQLGNEITGTHSTKMDTELLLATLEQIAPIAMQSWGPTSEDKINMMEMAHA